MKSFVAFKRVFIVATFILAVIIVGFFASDAFNLPPRKYEVLVINAIDFTEKSNVVISEIDNPSNIILYTVYDSEAQKYHMGQVLSFTDYRMHIFLACIILLYIVFMFITHILTVVRYKEREIWKQKN